MQGQFQMQNHEQLLSKYFVPYMGMYTDEGGEITLLLQQLESGKRLSEAECKFLQDKGLQGLSAYARHYANTGIRDRRLLRTAEDRRREAALERRKLWSKYEIEYLDREHAGRMREILRRLDIGGRLTDDDCRWLISIEAFTPILRQAFHSSEAAHFKSTFERTRNPRDAIKTNSHFRKAGKPQYGLDILEKVRIDLLGEHRLKSAYCTTKGGSLRDVGRHDEAMQHAQDGHAHDPDSFHPCTLLGALHYEAGDRVEGDAWFAKAVERGAKQENVDMELRAIWRRSSHEQRLAMHTHLLALDPLRYAWASALKSSTGRRNRGRTKATQDDRGT
jgi:hypothetical protein